jgi:hypothetical protein
LLHQNQNIFFSNIGNQNIFLEKNHNPPFKLNGRSLNMIMPAMIITARGFRVASFFFLKRNEVRAVVNCKPTLY